MASGGIRNAMDVAKAIAMGADGAVIGTADLVALECVRCCNCESGAAAPAVLPAPMPSWVMRLPKNMPSRRLVNMYSAWRKQWCELLRQYGLRSIKELVGRSDLLVHLDYLDEEERQEIPAGAEEETGIVKGKVKIRKIFEL